jgi:hypothetical protein
VNGFERLREMGMTEADASRLADQIQPLKDGGGSAACGCVIEVRHGRIVRVAAAALRKMWAIGG